MNNTYLQRYQYITVAIAFDRHSVDLARIGGQIAKRTGKTLCLLHAVEPWMEQPHSRPMGQGSPLWDVTQAVERNAADLAATRLKELASMIEATVKTESRVVSGKPSDSLAEAAQIIGSSLLIIGADLSQMRFMPRGFSTALSLMVTSPVPLMVVDTTLYNALPENPWRLFVADDLGEQNSEAVQFAFDLAAAAHATELHHVHVNGLSLIGLKAGIETAAMTARTPINATVSAEEVHAALRATLERRLADRAQPMRDYLEAAGGEYFPTVVTGNVSDEIEKLVFEVNPDVVIFGRHQTYHTRPFFIGRQPFRAMLGQKRPIVVVPDN